MADDKDKPATGDDKDKLSTEPAEPLGDTGKKALEDERKARREAERQLKTVSDRLKGLEDKDKSESERLTEKVAQLERDLTTATARGDRFEVALEKGLDMVRAKRLTGTTREELEADADELQTWQAGNGDKPPGKPTESLKGGGDPTGDEPDPDMRQIVADTPRGF